jgi:hypothetical protein
LLATGSTLEYGSVSEALAISDFNRQRNVIFTEPMMVSAKGSDIDRVYKAWQNSVYPETRLDSIKYLKKAENLFEKFKHMNLSIVGI